MNTQDFERIKNEVAHRIKAWDGKYYKDWADLKWRCNSKEIEEYITEAAMQFAKECCERQRELCNMAAEWYAPDGAYMDNYINSDQIFINEKSILNASLAVDLLSAPVKTDKDDTKTKA